MSDTSTRYGDDTLSYDAGTTNQSDWLGAVWMRYHYDREGNFRGAELMVESQDAERDFPKQQRDGTWK